MCRRTARLVAMAGLIMCTCGAGLIQAADFQHVGLYQSFEELVTWSGEFASRNADLVEVVSFGLSAQGRPLLALQISERAGDNDPDKPEFLFTAGLHAREVIGSQAAYELAEHLVDGYRSGAAEFREILGEREIWIIPNLNPDGRVRVEQGDGRQRKNMELYPRQNAADHTRGVDLNRNFPHRWAQAPDDVPSDAYRGPSPLSTPEASALWSLVHDTRYFTDLWAAIDFHAGMETILTPWMSSSEFHQYPLPGEDREIFDRLATDLSDVTGFTTDRPPYDYFGTLADSLYEELGTMAIIEELYVGPSAAFPDYFAQHNPLDAATRDDRIARAISSSLFLLSDQAFLIIPEPLSRQLGGIGLFALLVAAGRRRRLVASGLVLLSPALLQFGHAAVIFDYQGNPFDFASPPYALTDRLEGHVEFATEPKPSGEFGKQDVVNYSFHTGSTVWTMRDTKAIFLFDFSARGEIANWSHVFFGSEVVPSSLSREKVGLPLSRGDILATADDGIVAIAFTPGRWIRRGVPEPTFQGHWLVAAGWVAVSSRRRNGPPRREHRRCSDRQRGGVLFRHAGPWTT